MLNFFISHRVWRTWHNLKIKIKNTDQTTLVHVATSTIHCQILLALTIAVSPTGLSHVPLYYMKQILWPLVNSTKTSVESRTTRTLQKKGPTQAEIPNMLKGKPGKLAHSKDRSQYHISASKTRLSALHDSPISWQKSSIQTLCHIISKLTSEKESFGCAPPLSLPTESCPQIAIAKCLTH